MRRKHWLDKPILRDLFWTHIALHEIKEIEREAREKRESEQQRIEMIRHIDTLDRAASADIHKWRGKK